MDIDDTLDAVGLLCPLPVLKARKRLKAMKEGQVLRVMANDPAAVIDFPHFCTEQGHTLLFQEHPGDVSIYYLQKGKLVT